jgi:hypothetical protein
MVLAEEFGTGQVLWSMLWFTMFFLWIWLLIAVFSDLFRDHEMSGGAKALWCIFVIVLPYLGVFAYLIARGGKMGKRAQEAAQAQDAAFRSYVQEAAADNPSGQLTTLSTMHDKGVINDDEFKRMKSKIVPA